MEIQPIRTDKEHQAALAEIDRCWGALDGTEEGDRLDVLLALVEIYEAKRWPIDIDESFDPVDVLRHRGARAHPGRIGRASRLAIARFGNSLTPARPHGRHDPQDQRDVESSG